MLKIGMLGPDYLWKSNQKIFQQLQIKAYPIYRQDQLSCIDGLLITGWKTTEYQHQLCALSAAITQRKQQLSILGIAAGAVCLGKNGLLSALDCTISAKAGRGLTMAALEMPGYTEQRFTAYFFPEIRFQKLAPNLGVLCQDSKRGPIVVRQGNCLACGYAAELTPQPHIYNYWLEMVAALKNSRKK